MRRTTITLLTFIFTAIWANGDAIAEISVYDRYNKFLGYLVDVDKGYSVTIFEPSSKACVVLAASENSSILQIQNNQTLVFESNNCTGEAYVTGISAVPMAVNYFGDYYRRTDDNVEIISIGSRAKGPWTCEKDSMQIYAYKTVKVSLPFSWEVLGPLKISYDVTQSKTVVVVPLSNN